MKTDFAKQSCEPCDTGVCAMTDEERSIALAAVGNGWAFASNNKIERTFSFRNFLESIEFVRAVARIAEAEGHHPDIHIHWNKVRLVLYTHAIDNLSPNDFILAAKINEI